MTTDVLIVGAGPSGSHLAYLLARQGRQVVVADRERFPRDKVCGGGLSGKTVALLDFDVGRVVQRQIRGAWLTFQNRDTIESALDPPSGCAVMRADFDALLLRRATDAGAIFRPACAFQQVVVERDGVRVQTSQGELRARYLVGADGVFSRVRRALFPADLVRYAPAVEVLVPVDDGVMAVLGDRVLFDFGGVPRGYGWIFPKKDHLNVGVYSIYPRRSIRDDLARFMARYALFEKCDGSAVLGHAIPTGNRHGVYAAERVLLVGDAAGFAEPFYGEGIYFALRSAMLAAEAFARGGSRRIEDEYARLIRRELAPDLFYSNLNARLFYPRQRFGFDRMVRNRLCNRYFGEVIGGRVGYRECFYKTAATMPYWLCAPRITPSPMPRL